MSHELPFAYAETDGDTRRPWLEDRRERERLLGMAPPRVVIPTYPEVLVVPGYAKDRALPTHFRAYCRLGVDVLSDAGPTYEQARWSLLQTVEARA